MAKNSFLTNILEHPQEFGSFRNWIAMLRASNGIDARYWPRVLMVSLTTLLTSPLRLAEHIRYDRAVEQTEIHPAPVVIVGHWRSGTTHLHNLLCQDPSFAYVTTFQALMPGFCLIGERGLKPLLGKIGRRLHPTRIIDNIPLSFDAPQEEDYAVANLSPYSFLHMFSFPRQAEYYFKNCVLLEGVPAEARAAWARTYLAVLRKATFHAGGKRLALKNPAHSGRIPALLELFPDARFIHIYRNPYDVFLSMRHLFETVLPRSQVQDISAAGVDECILQFYVELMQRFFADRALIPPENYVEVQFEELERTPLEQMRRIYDCLRLPRFDTVEPALRSYIASIADYRKNPYPLMADVIAKVNARWQFAFEAWGYPRLEPDRGQ